MATLYEYYNTGDDGSNSIYAGEWWAQTFTPSIEHTITSVKLLLYRVGSPGTVTVSIRATSSGLPTGNDLCSGTIDGDTFTTDTAGLWYEITLGAGSLLTADTKYAIVVRAAGVDSNNKAMWREDNTSPTYAGGSLIYSSNSGSSWTAYTTSDLMFEEWGTPTPQTYNLSASDGIKQGDTSITAVIFGASITDGIKQGDDPTTTAILNSSITDGIKQGDSPVPTTTAVGTSALDLTSDVILMAWINPDTLGENNLGHIINKLDSYRMYLSGTNRLTLGLTGVTGADFSSDNNAITLGAWQHVAGVRNGTTGVVSLMVNGIIVKTIAGGTEALAVTSTNLYIGDKGDADRAFDGKIGLVKILKSNSIDAVINHYNQMKHLFGVW